MVSLACGTSCGASARAGPQARARRGQRRCGGAQRSRLDAFTLAALGAHTQMLDREHVEFGPDYTDHGLLFCWEDGRPPHPDTITHRFHTLAAAAGLPKIKLRLGALARWAMPVSTG